MCDVVRVTACVCSVSVELVVCVKILCLWRPISFLRLLCLETILSCELRLENNKSYLNFQELANFFLQDQVHASQESRQLSHHIASGSLVFVPLEAPLVCDNCKEEKINTFIPAVGKFIFCFTGKNFFQFFLSFLISGNFLKFLEV